MATCFQKRDLPVFNSHFEAMTSAMEEYESCAEIHTGFNMNPFSMTTWPLAGKQFTLPSRMHEAKGNIG